MADALVYIDQLRANRNAGFDDWRLPTVEELMSLVEPRPNDNQEFIDSSFSGFGWCLSADKIFIGGLGATTLLAGVDFIYGVISEWGNIQQQYTHVCAVRSMTVDELRSRGATMPK